MYVGARVCVEVYLQDMPIVNTLDVRYWCFGFSFGLVILETPGIDHKIIQPESALGIESISLIILYMNESLLLVKIAYIPVHTSHANY